MCYYFDHFCFVGFGEIKQKIQGHFYEGTKIKPNSFNDNQKIDVITDRFSYYVQLIQWAFFYVLRRKMCCFGQIFFCRWKYWFPADKKKKKKRESVHALFIPEKKEKYCVINVCYFGCLCVWSFLFVYTTSTFTWYYFFLFFDFSFAFSGLRAKCEMRIGNRE